MVFAAVLAAAGIVSCEKERTLPALEEIEVPVSSATGFFRGTGDADFDMYLLELCQNGVEATQSGFSGIGAAVLIDMNTPANGGNPMRILDGTYYPSDESEMEDYVFYLGIENSLGDISQSYVYYRPNGRTAGHYYPVTGGSLVLSSNGARHEIVARMETDAYVFVFSYAGLAIPYYDASDDDDNANYVYPENGGTPGDRQTYKSVVFNNYNLGSQVYWGYLQDSDKKPVTGYTNWDIELFDSYETNGFLRLEINTEEDVTDAVTAGKYVFKEKNPGDFTELSLVPGALIAGSDADNMILGSWFFDSDNPIDDKGTYRAYRVTDGMVDVAINSDKSYTISYTLFDDYEGYILTGVSNVAALEYVNGPEQDNDADISSAKYSPFSGKLGNAICPKIRRVSGKDTRATKVPAFIKAHKRGR